jgi:hypothetical protein
LCQFLFSLGDRLGDIKPSKTGAKFDNICIPVITGADNIEIFLFFAGS